MEDEAGMTESQKRFARFKVLIPDDLASLSDDAIIEHMASLDRDSAEWQQFTRDGQWVIVGEFGE